MNINRSVIPQAAWIKSTWWCGPEDALCLVLVYSSKTTLYPFPLVLYCSPTIYLFSINTKSSPSCLQGYQTLFLLLLLLLFSLQFIALPPYFSEHVFSPPLCEITWREWEGNMEHSTNPHRRLSEGACTDLGESVCREREREKALAAFKSCLVHAHRELTWLGLTQKTGLMHVCKGLAES